MRISTKLIYIAGILIIGLSIARWWFMFYDPSQAIIGTLIGIIICGFAYLYDWMNIKDMKIRNMDARIESLVVELTTLIISSAITFKLIFKYK
jgi:hypothetical protein